MHANIFQIKIITQHTEFNLYGKDLFYFYIDYLSFYKRKHNQKN
jgi:hypothetical protein